MSEDFSELRLRVGAEPRRQGEAIRAAREASPEFDAEVRAAEQFEERLEQAFRLPLPRGLLDELAGISRLPVEPESARNWWPTALAASLLIAVGAAGMAWKLNPSWDSVEAYVVDHYRHDGPKMLAQAGGDSAQKVQEILAEFEVSAAPALADIVGVIKYCPTPEGKGVHMVLNTPTGPLTLIYMPETSVTDRQTLAFDDVEAMLVGLKNGSAVIIGASRAGVQEYYALVQQSIIPSPRSS
jgi:hypothetical protein